MFKSHNEIFNQGTSLELTYKFILGSREKILEFFTRNEFHDIVFVACGASYWSSLSASMSFSEALKRPCFAVKSGDILLNADYYKNLYDRPLVIALSRSGSTTETLMAIDFFKKHFKSPVISIVGYENSPIIEKSDFNLQIPWITEESICQTGSFSSLYLSVLLISAILNPDPEMISDLQMYIQSFNEISTVTEEKIRYLISSFPELNSLYVLGNGKQYGIAIEAAYINIEMATLHAGFFGTLEFRHGPVVLCNPQTLIVILSNGLNIHYEKKLSEEISNTGAKVMFISPEPCHVKADFLFSCHCRKPETIALYGVFVMQGVAYYTALKKGLNPDEPKNLAQWIKIEPE